MGKKRKRRTHGIIDELPQEMRNKVQQMLFEGKATYTQIAELLIKQGVRISKTSVARYANRFFDEMAALKLSQQSLQMISSEISSNPELDLTEGALRMAMGALMTSISTLGPEQMDKLDPEVQLKLLVAMGRTINGKRRTDQLNKDTADLAIEACLSHIYNVLGTEHPDLYIKLSEVLNAMKGTDITRYSDG